MNISNDPIRDESMQHSLDKIRDDIMYMIEASDDNTVSNGIITDIELPDIDKYMKKIQYDQDLPYKLTKISSKVIDNIETFYRICDISAVCNVPIPQGREQKVYFIETSDFALTFIPIKLGNRRVSIFMQSLAGCPDFITEMWAEANEKMTLDDIPFVKFNQ